MRIPATAPIPARRAVITVAVLVLGAVVAAALDVGLWGQLLVLAPGLVLSVRWGWEEARRQGLGRRGEEPRGTVRASGVLGGLAAVVSIIVVNTGQFERFYAFWIVLIGVVADVVIRVIWARNTRAPSSSGRHQRPHRASISCRGECVP